MAPTLFRGDYLRAETRWLSQLPGVREHLITLDNKSFRHNQRFALADMAPGHHYFDIAATLDDGTLRSYHIPFSVVNKLDIVVDPPVVDLDVDPSRPNGVKVPLKVRNNTAHEIAATLTVHGVPAGWKAVVTNGLPQRIPARKEKRLTLHVEMMNDLGGTRENVAVTVAAHTSIRTALGRTPSAASLVTGTVYIRASIADDDFIAMTKTQSAIRRHKPSISFGPPLKP